jgi:hypothetical protein
MEIQEYYRRRAKDAAKLDPETAAILAADHTLPPMYTYRASTKVIWIISVDNEDRGSFAGQVVEVNPWLASELCFAGTHRLATDEEIKGEQARREQKQREILAEDRARRSQSTVVQVSPDALRAAIAGLGIKQE